jgi:hypothetical protein
VFTTKDTKNTKKGKTKGYAISTYILGLLLVVLASLGVLGVLGGECSSCFY